MARGKALVAELRSDPKVRDAQALAAWIGRKKKLRLAALKAARASADARKPESRRETRREGAARVAADVKRKGNRRAAGRAPREFRERQSREGSEPGLPTVSKAERNRVSKGNPNADRWADRLDVKAGQEVQLSRNTAYSGEVVGVTENGRLRVYWNDGSEDVLSRSQVYLLTPRQKRR